ncbi:Uncharacterised protein [Mycobacteroides abscessus subsp. bolletii]|nr:Uncharacterised protein [Mycobacteroides abscessus subsp. bolletii]SKP52661.1 Uncharacterised protein [Mycobacteroides abscessus subsp. bolletii]SKP84314.1 Uncharacterised protein [Mycobacteroides abscessus subsp. bolletii]SKQ12962.1 Uncharacterised protein [Mycobacteroides abscessus subsp. bolletii]
MPTEIVYRNYFSIARDADDASKFLAQGASALTLALARYRFDGWQRCRRKAVGR